jgi:hypothetical protein
MPDLVKAKSLLEKAKSDCKSAQQIADGQGKYASAKQRAVDALAALNLRPAEQKTLITKDLEAIQKDIDAATAKAETEKKLDQAITLLEQAQTKLNQARLKADVKANLKPPLPNPDFVKLLADEPGGTKVLDDAVAQMDENTSRVVLEAALEARFKVNLHQFLSEDGITIGSPPNEKKVHGTADNRAPDKSVKRIYELLQKVPESHGRDNPKVENIRRFQEDIGGGAYGGGEIDLNCGRAGAMMSSDQGAELCSPKYFPDGVDKDCLPADDAKDKEILYFDWCTLHEVGHAVDDNKRFMINNMADPKCGRWEVYGNDPTAAATAANNHFKLNNLQYIKDRLNGLTPPAPAKPGGKTAEEWSKIVADVDEWCDLVSGLKLWWDGEGSKKVAIGGRVHQKAYKTKWVSYDLSARNQGIHGYQFRAPGEWFAELYAAYYMGVLKPAHPAVKDWLPSALT